MEIGSAIKSQIEMNKEAMEETPTVNQSTAARS